MTGADTVPFTSIAWTDVLFVALSAMLLVSAILVVTLRDIIRCGIALMASFAALAGIYLLLGNPIVAATEVIVYIGAISVLILFAIMLTQTKNAPTRLVFQTQAWIAAIAAIAIAGVIVAAVLGTTWPAEDHVLTTTAAQAGKLLFHEYVLPFEVVSVMLTVAVVGGVFLARRDPSPRREPGRGGKEEL
jgi:NADH:ubiquinone oxidoreductase subunit 6 (subunit J)